MKRLAQDDAGLIPLLVGVAVAGGLLFGGSYVLTGEDPMTALMDLLKAITAGSMLFIFGVLLLMNKLPVVPSHLAMLGGIVCVCVGIYWIWKGVPF